MREILILLGPPGVGKGTVGTAVAMRRGVPLISSGDLLREAVSRGTDLGRQAKSLMDRGELVPDEIVVGLVRERTEREDCRAGFILDGFPRTLRQAELLTEMLGQGSDCRVLNLSATDDFLARRLANRRICDSCGRIYHLVNMPPATAGICDACGARLVTRADDAAEIILRRLTVYHGQTAPLLAYYAGRGLLREITGELVLAETLELVAANVGW